MNRKKTSFITVLSAKGGIGKTFFITNLGYLLHKAKKEVLIFDLNFRFPNVYIFLGGNSNKTLDKFLNGEQEFIELIENSEDKIKYISGLITSSKISLRNIQKFIYEIKNLPYQLDYVILDTPCDISEITTYLVSHSDRVILLTSNEVSSILNTFLLVKYLISRVSVDFEVVVNLVESKIDAEITFEELNSLVKNFLKTELDFLGYIHRDDKVQTSVKEETLIAKRYRFSRYKRDLETIQQKITNGR